MVLLPVAERVTLTPPIGFPLPSLTVMETAELPPAVIGETALTADCDGDTTGPPEPEALISIPRRPAVLALVRLA
jgi:hypothetical protein